MIADTGDDPPSLFQHNINTNLQVCAGNMTGLPEVMDTYFRFYETKFDDFRLNAKRFFGCRGVLGNVHCDYNSGPVLPVLDCLSALLLDCDAGLDLQRILGPLSCDWR